jgi:S-adenosylmethionine:tRNA ribosyltransferase-isomerase
LKNYVGFFNFATPQKAHHFNMKLSKFKFDLPSKLIAEFPPKQRGDSKLMVIDRETETIEHKQFSDILDYFEEGDSMVVNNTRVFPARLFGRKEKTGAKIEVFLLRELNAEMRLWDVLVDPARKIRVGNKLYFGEEDMLVAEVFDNTTSRGRTIRFLYEGDDEEFRKTLKSLGQTPLPKYIKRAPEKIDEERYQTIYAKHEGAVAAPTAGLHFNEEIIKKFQIMGVDIAEVTLHVGLGTFRPIEVEDLSKHKMDAEYFNIGSESADLVNQSKRAQRTVCAVGTTSMRTIESSVSASGMLNPAEGWTNLFIHPPYDFKIANRMVTNFHLPKSSLVIMVAAFGGYDLIMEAYKEAIKKKYRFFTYGDAMLIL